MLKDFRYKLSFFVQFKMTEKKEKNMCKSMLPVTVQPETVHFYSFTKKKDFDTKFLGQAMRELYDHWVGELALH